MNRAFKTIWVYFQAFVCSNSFANIFAETVIFLTKIRLFFYLSVLKIAKVVCVGIKLSSQQLVMIGVTDA